MAPDPRPRYSECSCNVRDLLLSLTETTAAAATLRSSELARERGMQAYVDDVLYDYASLFSRIAVLDGLLDPRIHTQLAQDLRNTYQRLFHALIAEAGAGRLSPTVQNLLSTMRTQELTLVREWGRHGS